LRFKYIESCLKGKAAKDGYAVQLDHQDAEVVQKSQKGYWRTQAAMDKAGDAVGESEHKTPTMVVLGSQDLRVPSQANP